MDTEKQEPSNGKHEKEQYQQSPEEISAESPKDFKIAEIWIRDGQIHLDASGEFWGDRCRALGVLMFCQEIVKTAKGPQEQKSKIVKESGFNAIDFVRNGFKKKK